MESSSPLVGEVVLTAESAEYVLRTLKILSGRLSVTTENPLTPVQLEDSLYRLKESIVAIYNGQRS